MIFKDVIDAHRRSFRHREEVVASDKCGCFYCCEIFPPSAITEWVDEDETTGIGQTALCPLCGIDAVIGSASGYPITDKFLSAMQAHWF